MKQKIIFGVFTAMGIGLIPLLAYAHQPRILESPTEPVTVLKPEVSKAYYTRLTGERHEYRISQDDNFEFHVGILVPDIPSSEKDFTIQVLRNDELWFEFNGAKEEWKPFFEDFGRDKYLQGPEKTTDAEPGTYRILVGSPDNEGTYVLVIGDDEQFPFGEALSAVKIIPQIKQQFFGKSAWSAFESPFIAVPAAIAVMLLLVVIWMFRR